MDNKLSLKDKIFLALSFFYIIYIIFPLFADITGIPVYIPSIFVVISLFTLFPNILTNRVFRWFGIYVGVLILYILIGKPIHINGVNSSLSPWYRLVIEMAWILPSITIASILLYRNDVRLFNILSKGSVILLLISFIYVIPMLSVNANYLREDIDVNIRPIGLPGYDLMHAYALMLFPLCLTIRYRQHLNKFLHAFLVIIFFYIVTKTAVTTSLFVCLFSICAFIVYKPSHKMRNYTAFILLLSIVLVLYICGYFIDFLDAIMPYFDGTAVYDKLQDMRDSLTAGTITGSTLTGRIDYHEMSKQSFLNNPIIGSDAVGGHSKLLDVLGSMGIVGFVPYVMIVISAWHSYKISSKVTGAKIYLLVSFILSGIYLYNKGVFGSPGYLFMFVLVPSMIMSLEYKKSK